jgi:hypothetical protein
MRRKNDINKSHMKKAGKTKGERTTRARAVTGRRGRNFQSAEIKLAELKRRLLEINDLSTAGALLSWDHATYMPKRGATARTRDCSAIGPRKVGRLRARQAA